MKRLRWFRQRWWLRDQDDDKRPYFESSIIFQATDMDEADRLQEAMLDAIGCDEEHHFDDERCPHFRVGGLHQVDDD